MPRPRVLLVGPEPPPLGGIASVIRTILASDAAQRFEFTRFPTNQKRFHPRTPFGRLADAALARGLGLDGSRNLEARAQLAAFREALAVRPDLVHLHTWHGWDFWIAGRMAHAARERGIASIHHVHGNFDVIEPGWSRAKRAAFRRALTAPDRLVVLSESWKRWFIPHLDASRIEVLHNAVDTARFAPAQRERDDALRVLFVGTRDAELKGAYDLLAVIPDVVRAEPRAHFVFAGEDPERLEARFVRGTPLAPHCTFAGRRSAEEMPALYVSADLLVLPSHREGMPMALLEAMATGLPVVASDLHAIREVLPADGGACVRPGDRAALAAAIGALLADPVRRSAAGAANRARAVRDYGLVRFAERLASLYDRTIAARDATSARPPLQGPR
jgi:glycosyltransferase involved in cell wall biosynthesis